MADDVRLNTGSGGDLIAADDISGTKHQRVKIQYGDDGSATDVSVTRPLPTTLGDGEHVDAFGRLRMSEATTIFESKLLMADKAPLLWDEQLESGASISASTPTAAKPYIDYTTTLNTAGVFTRQTFRRFAFQAGKSQLVELTGVLDLSGGGTGVERRIGLFDDNNGLFFADIAGTVNVVSRTNDSGTPVDTAVAQSSWNVDPMDGTGFSGLTVDWTKAQDFVIDFQWPVGRIRMGLDIGGVLHEVHDFLNANAAAIPNFSSPNLPLRFQIETTGSSPASTMRCVSATVMTEAGRDPVAMPFSEATVAHVDANVADTVYAVIGLRLAAVHVGCTIDLTQLAMLAETNDDFEWQIRVNPTVASTFTYSAITNSNCETALGATANTVTNGTIIDRGFGAGTGGAVGLNTPHNIKLGSAIDGTVDEIVLCVRPLGANADIQGALNWHEHH